MQPQFQSQGNQQQNGTDMEIPSWSKQFQSDGLEALYTNPESVSIPDFALHQGYEIQRFDTENLILQEGNQPQEMVQYGNVVAAEQSDESHVANGPMAYSLIHSIYDGLSDTIPTLSSTNFEPVPHSFNIEDIGGGYYMGFDLPQSDLNSKLITAPELAPTLPGFDSSSQDTFDAEAFVNREPSLATYPLEWGNHAHYGLIQDNIDQRLNKRNLGAEEENQQNKKIKRGINIVAEQSDGIGMALASSSKESQSDGLEALYLHTNLVSIPSFASNQVYEIQSFDTRNLSLEEANKQKDMIQCGNTVAAKQSDESQVASMPTASSSMNSIFDGLPNVIPTESSADFEPPPHSFNIEDIGDGECMGFYSPSYLNSKPNAVPELAPALPGFDSTSQNDFDAETFVRELSLATYRLQCGNHASW